jgi:sugar phosphate isomerase/epimerase
MKTLFTLALLLTSFISHGQRFGKTLKETPGVVSYTYRVELGKDAPAALDQIRKEGITNIELSNLFGKTATEFRQLLDERGMRCTSYGVGYNDLAEKLDEVIANAKILGAEFVRIAWIPHTAPFTLEVAQAAVDLFNAAGKKMKEQGLMFCYHNHGYEFIPHGNGTFFDFIVENTDPAYVGFEMDIMWTALPGQDPAALLKKYPNRFYLMHIKDMRKGMEPNNTGRAQQTDVVPIGTGALDIKGIMKAARKTNIKYYYIEDEHPEAAKQVPLSLQYLKTI